MIRDQATGVPAWKEGSGLTGKGEQADFIKHTRGGQLTADEETILQVGRAHKKVDRRHKNVFKRVMLNLYVARKRYHFLRYLNRTICMSCI